MLTPDAKRTWGAAAKLECHSLANVFEVAIPEHFKLHQIAVTAAAASLDAEGIEHKDKEEQRREES
jgi:hypothetical protein